MKRIILLIIVGIITIMMMSCNAYVCPAYADNKNSEVEQNS